MLNISAMKYKLQDDSGSLKSKQTCALKMRNNIPFWFLAVKLTINVWKTDGGYYNTIAK